MILRPVFLVALLAASACACAGGPGGGEGARAVPPLEDLVQRSLDGTPLSMAALLEGNAVRLGATVRVGNTNRCTARTRLEVEVRRHDQRFRGSPTHSVEVERDGGVQRVPAEVRAEGLPWNEGFAWQARQVRLEVWEIINGPVDEYRCEVRGEDASRWEIHTLAPLVSFRTPRHRQRVVVGPSAVSAVVGIVLGGGTASLLDDDGDEYLVRAATGVPTEAAWEATIPDVTPYSVDLEGRLRSRSDFVCTQSVHVWNVADGTWSLLASGTLATFEAETAFQIAGRLDAYVAPGGDLRLRVACVKSGPPAQPFRADLLEVAYDRATPP